MGTLILNDLITEVSDHLAGRSDVTNNRIVRALNLAQEHMARSKDYEELRVRENGSLPYTGVKADDKFLLFSSLTNTDPNEIYSFRLITSDGRSRKLVYKSTRLFDKDIPEPEFYASGLPSIYTVWQDKFEFWKVQDKAYTYDLRMTIWPTALSTSNLNATSSFKQKDDLLIHLAVSWIFASLAEYELARQFYGYYAQRVEIAEREDMRKVDREIKPDFEAAVVVRSRGYDDPFVKFIR